MFKKIGKLLYHLIHLNRWVFMIFTHNKRLDEIEGTLRSQHLFHEALQTQLSQQEEKLSQQEEKLSQQEEKLSQQEEKLSQQEEKLQNLLGTIEDLAQKAVAKQIFYHAMGMHQRIDQFLFDLKQEACLIDVEMQDRLNRAKAIFLDDYYLSFENSFRGSREDIMERYVPYLAYFKVEEIHNALDIGCGRGEWVELLQSKGIDAQGVDTNHAMIDLCHKSGLKSVTCKDALSYLEKCSDESFDLISAFHLIEHLPMEILLSLLASIKRVLKPHGKLLLETPNPDNLLVSSLMFYNDPTHRNPIPKEVTAFMVDYMGLEKVEIVPLHPFPPKMHFNENSDISKVLNERMFGPQDYLIIAQKPHVF